MRRARSGLRRGCAAWGKSPDAPTLENDVLVKLLNRDKTLEFDGKAAFEMAHDLAGAPSEFHPRAYFRQFFSLQACAGHGNVDDSDRTLATAVHDQAGFALFRHDTLVPAICVVVLLLAIDHPGQKVGQAFALVGRKIQFDRESVAGR